MASEAITRNDLTAILNEVLPSQSYVSEVTISYNSSSLNSYSGYCVRCGRVVTLSLVLNCKSAGTNLLLASFDSINRPLYTQWLSCDYWTCTNGAEAYVDTGGGIYVSTPTSGNDLKISGTWITAE